MKLAPNVKQQSRGIKHKETEVIIFAGSDAWSHAKQWQEHDARMAGDNEPPVWLGEQQLSGYCRQRNQCPRGTSRREQTQNHRHTG